jgi:hypothetical protein
MVQRCFLVMFCHLFSSATKRSRSEKRDILDQLVNGITIQETIWTTGYARQPPQSLWIRPDQSCIPSPVLFSSSRCSRFLFSKRAQPQTVPGFPMSYSLLCPSTNLLSRFAHPSTYFRVRHVLSRRLSHQPLRP